MYTSWWASHCVTLSMTFELAVLAGHDHLNQCIRLTDAAILEVCRWAFADGHKQNKVMCCLCVLVLCKTCVTRDVLLL